MRFAESLLILALVSASAPALAQSKAPSGSAEEQDACRPDVRRFCSHVARGADDMEYLKCLELNRDSLSKRCLAVLVDHGR